MVASPATSVIWSGGRQYLATSCCLLGGHNCNAGRECRCLAHDPGQRSIVDYHFKDPSAAECANGTSSMLTVATICGDVMFWRTVSVSRSVRRARSFGSMVSNACRRPPRNDLDDDRRWNVAGVLQPRF
jgi:hypothetical protein